MIIPYPYDGGHTFVSPRRVPPVICLPGGKNGTDQIITFKLIQNVFIYKHAEDNNNFMLTQILNELNQQCLHLGAVTALKTCFLQ